MPAAVVTVTATLLRLLAPRLGTLAVMVVALTTDVVKLEILLNLTVAPATKLVPVMVTVAPPPAELGEMAEMVGAWAAAV